jgi:hypothetical protein
MSDGGSRTAMVAALEAAVLAFVDVPADRGGVRDANHVMAAALRAGQAVGLFVLRDVAHR